MSKSLTRQVRREQAKRIANKVLKFYGGEEMPTVEQLYTLIGAKDGVIYDLQLNLSGLVQEKQRLEAALAEAEEKLAQYEEIRRHEGRDILADVPEELVSRELPSVGRPIHQVRRPSDENLSKPGDGHIETDQDEEGDFGATFKPR